MVARQLKDSAMLSGRSELLFLLVKTGSQRCQPSWKCKCKPKKNLLAVLQQQCQTPCSLNVLKAFYFIISSSSPALSTRMHSEIRADFYSTSTSEHRVEGHKSSLTAHSHLAPRVLQKTSSTRKVFSFCQSFQSGTSLQNRAQMAAEQWLRCKPSIEASGTFPSLTSSFFFFKIVLETNFKCTKNIRK